MRFKRIIKMFEDGNVIVFGLRGRGKDMLMSNVVVRRKLPYVSNVDYGGEYHPFNYKDIDCGKNTYKNFIEGNLQYYEYPYADGTDVYISDGGVYFPSQFCNELNRDYKFMATFQSLSRHLGLCNFHINSQSCGRIYDKIREQGDQFILCRRCIYLFGIIIQQVTIYDRYETANSKMKPLRLPMPLFPSREMKLQREIEEARHEAQYGEIRNGWLIYRNKSTYDTRRFKTLLKEGIKQ